MIRGDDACRGAIWTGGGGAISSLAYTRDSVRCPLESVRPVPSGVRRSEEGRCSVEARREVEPSVKGVGRRSVAWPEQDILLCRINHSFTPLLPAMLTLLQYYCTTFRII